jgi:uncharacterized protein YbjQ (UPF0145 family)
VTDEQRAWSSSLTTNDFAACVEAGYEPLGFVQGCSVISWGWGSGMTSQIGFGAAGGGAVATRGYSEQFACPHGFVGADHRMYGLNYEQDWVEDAWRTGFLASYERLVEEAARLSAHGVIAVVDRVVHDPDTATYRFTAEGTAVRVAGAPDSKTPPFSTFLAGQKLNKLLEAGFAPVAIVAEFVSVQVYSSCVTEYLLRGRGAVGWGAPVGGEVDQVSRAHEAARRLARERLRKRLGSDRLHAAHLDVREHETMAGPQIDVMLKGNRVRQFKAYDPLPLPRPVVRLVD